MIAKLIVLALFLTVLDKQRLFFNIKMLPLHIGGTFLCYTGAFEWKASVDKRRCGYCIF